MRTVVVLVESSRAYGRGLLRGIAQYNREQGPWSLYLQPHGLGAPPPPWLQTWQGDGILARICDRTMARAVLRWRRPVVDLRGDLPDSQIPFIGVDNRAVGHLAAEHLLECGLRHFAFCALPPGSARIRIARRDPFVERIARAGHRVHVLPDSKKSIPCAWNKQQERLAAWIHRLPKPVGVMACQDDTGLQLLDACRRASVCVPDEVAVVSVDDDELLCNTCSPPLTSIDLNPEQIGFEAAALLDRLMRGKRPPRGPILVPPRGVVARQSTDLVAVEDAEVAAAVRYIRQYACSGLRVSELLRQLSLSRNVLERRFQQLVGRTPKAEIARVQLAHAERLLAETHLSLDEVAARTGFRDARYLCDVFARRLQITPGAYRAKHRRQAE